MILVTLGTQKQSFKRLLDYVENADIDDEIIVQAGYTKYDSKKQKIFDFISYDEMNKYIEKADLIITHAGTGSIVSALKKGKKVIACARLKKYGEHVDDHQEELVAAFYDAKYILKVDENISLNEVLKKLPTYKFKKFISNKDNFIKQLKEEMR